MTHKSVCFLHPNDPNQRAKEACKDMLAKFQKIHEEWMVFNQPIGRFKNNIKEGRMRTCNISVWLGSEVLEKKILEQCTLEWEETRANGGTINMAYKQDQSLYTARNLNTGWGAHQPVCRSSANGPQGKDGRSTEEDGQKEPIQIRLHYQSATVHT